MKVKTTELTGIALDYAVALASGATAFQSDDIRWFFTLHGDTYVLSSGWGGMSYQPSDNWAQGGPIIEQEGITLRVNAHISSHWVAFIDFGGSNCNIKARQSGPTPLIAAMRCVVAHKLGEEVEIPEELLK